MTPHAPWRDTRLPETVPCHALLYPDEIRYLGWVAGRAESRGRWLVDLGAYLGGSSIAMARGAAGAHGAGFSLLAVDSWRAVPPYEDPSPGACADGEDRSYLDLYLANTSAYADGITARPCFIEPWLGDARAAALFPERAPVGVLFIDCAKTWGVHHSIVRAFGPWLREGSVVVQQDFRGTLLDLHLHAYQLRERLRPSHLTIGGSVGFLATGPIPAETADRLWTPADIAEIGMETAIERAAAWLDDVSPEPLSAWTWLAAAGDRAGAGDGAGAAAWAARATRELEAAPPAHGTLLDLFDGEIERVAIVLDRAGDTSNAAACRALRGAGRSEDRPQAGPLSTPALASLWEGLAARWRARGLRRIALYGAGRHTQRLLAAGFPRARGIDIVAVLDDNDALLGTTMRGIPVRSPEDAPRDLDAVIPSSDAREAELLDRCRHAAARVGALCEPVYTAGPRALAAAG